MPELVGVNPDPRGGFSHSRAMGTWEGVPVSKRLVEPERYTASSDARPVLENRRDPCRGARRLRVQAGGEGEPCEVDGDCEPPLTCSELTWQCQDGQTPQGIPGSCRGAVWTRRWRATRCRRATRRRAMRRWAMRRRSTPLSDAPPPPLDATPSDAPPSDASPPLFDAPPSRCGAAAVRRAATAVRRAAVRRAAVRRGAVRRGSRRRILVGRSQRPGERVLRQLRAGAGDVNGDGYADVVVGAPGVNVDEPQEGQAYLYLGGASGLALTASWQGHPTSPGCGRVRQLRRGRGRCERRRV